MRPDEVGAVLMLVNEQRTFIDQNTHDWLVIHKTASGGSAQNIATFFANDPNMASTHYVVGQDGTIVQCVLEKDGAGGNCCLEAGHASFLPLGINLNVKTVSIEHVDPATDNSTPLTNAQKAASFKLVQHICERHNIPMRPGDASGGIIGHKDIAPLSRARCPGNYPWNELFAYLANGNPPPPPQERNTWMSTGQQHQAELTWAIGHQIVPLLFAGKDVPADNSGIKNDWVHRYMNGLNLGYAVTPETPYVGWDDKPIVAVWWSNGYRTEWDGSAHVYNAANQRIA